MLLNSGLNKIRDLHAANIDIGWCGTDGSIVTEAQTGLQAGVVASKKTVTIASSDKTNVMNYTLYSTEAVGNTFREFTVTLDGTVEYTRVTFTGVAHTANDDVVIKHSIFYRNP